MDNTVVGVYDSYTQADAAVNELISAGFSRDHVQLTPDTRNASTGQDGVGTAVRDSTESSGSAIGNFFRSLFGMDEHPEITFVSTSVARTGPSSLELTGNLTIKRVTHSVTIPFEFEGVATDPYGNQRAGLEGSVTINRKDYGIT